MLWDCPACGTTKLLGIDHRHCPNCGAPQEENLRYFPGRDARVETTFAGTEPDWACAHCGAPNGSRAGFCAGCGAPRGESSSVHVRKAIDASAAETSQDARDDWAARKQARRDSLGPTTRRSPLGAWLHSNRWWFLGALLSFAGFVGLVAFAEWYEAGRETSLEVTGHQWRRVIPIERYSTVAQTGWCEGMPSDAREQSRQSQLLRHDRVPDGEDCRSIKGSCSNTCRNVDNGNGSFSEVCTQTCTSDRTECTPKYREVPVYADECVYEVDRWVEVGGSEERGQGRTPRWPSPPSVEPCSTMRLGCERIGARRGEYGVQFESRPSTGEEVERWACAFAEDVWLSTEVGSRWTARVSRSDDTLRCGDIQPAR